MKKLLLFLIFISSPVLASQITLDNLDTMAVARSNINANFTELYTQAFDAMLVSIATLTDPGGDRIAFWDESANAWAWLSVGTGLTITLAEMTSSGGSSTVDDTEAFAAGWNGDVEGSSKNQLHDYLVNFDADADGSFLDETWYLALEPQLVDSAGLLAAIDDETGTGLSVFSISPIFTGTVGGAAITFTGLGTFGTLDVGAGDFTVDADGNVEGASYTSSAADTYRGVTLTENTANTNIDPMTIHYTADELLWQDESGNDQRIGVGPYILSSATNIAISAAQEPVQYGGTLYLTAAADVTLRPIADRMDFRAVTVGAHEVNVAPNTSDKIVLDGVTLDDGDKVTNTSTTGDELYCQYYSADVWYCKSYSPDGDQWTDGGGAAACMSGTYLLAWDGDHASGTNYVCYTSGAGTITGTNTGQLVVSSSYGDSSNGALCQTEDYDIKWTQTSDQYFSGADAQTLWVRMKLTAAPDNILRFLETVIDVNNDIVLAIATTGKLTGYYEATGVTDTIFSDAALTTGSYIDIAYSYNRLAADADIGKHVLNIGGAWETEQDELGADMTGSFESFSLGNQGISMTSSTTGVVHVDKWALVDGYKAVKPW